MFPRDWFAEDWFSADYWFGDGDDVVALRLDLWGGWQAMPAWWRLRKEDEEWIILND